jgi:hypothetical protein
MTGGWTYGARRTTAALALAGCLVVPGGTAHAEGGDVEGPAAASQSPTVGSSLSPGPSDTGNDTSADDGGRNWLGSIIGAGLLGLAGWTVWRSARVRSRYDDGYRSGDELRRDDPDMRPDDPDLRQDDEGSS